MMQTTTDKALMFIVHDDRFELLQGMGAGAGVRKTYLFCAMLC